MSKPQRLPSGRWRVRWIDETGKRRSQTFATAGQAQAASRRRRVEVDDIRSGKARPKSSLTVRVASEDWLATRPAKRRRSNEYHLRVHIWPFMGDKRLGDVTEELVRKFVRKLEATPVQPPKMKRASTPDVVDSVPPRVLSENTIANVQRTLSKFMGDMGYPIRLRLKVSETSYSWLRTEGDVARFLGGCGSGWFHAAAALAVYAGLRKGEIAGLRREDVDLKSGVISVWRSYEGPTKSKHTRHVPASPELVAILRRWFLRHPGPLVVTVNGHALLERTATDKRTRAACRRAGVEPVTFHQLRHTAASHLARRVPLPLVGAVLGHADPKTTARYAHHDTAALARDPRLHLSFAAPAGEVVALDTEWTRGEVDAAAGTENSSITNRSHSSAG